MKMRLVALAGFSLSLLAAPVAAKDRSRPAAPLGNPGEWFNADNYPPEAILAGAQGRTVAKIGVDADGRLSGCIIVESSGSPVLDAATCEIARAKGRFTPARDTLGRPIPAATILPVRWVLPASEPLDLSNGRKLIAEYTIEISVDENGVATACRTVTVAVESPDPCAGFIPGRRPGPSSVVNGKAVPATMTVKTLTYIDPK